MLRMLVRSLALLPIAIVAAPGQGSNCQTPACEGHKAGYEWAMDHAVTEQDCDAAGEHTNSLSFAEGCKTAVKVKQQFATTRQFLAPLLQEYELGKQVAKETRALPVDCEEAYKSLSNSFGPESLLPTTFRTGCLEIAKKQEKRIIREDERKAKDAEKQAKKQAGESAQRAAKNQ
jgi:hypothetical protein